MKLKLLVILLFIGIANIQCQEVVVTSGGNTTGDGTVSYSVGQTFVNVNNGNGSSSEGIQTSIEIFTLSNPEIKTILLEAKAFPNPSKDIVNLTIKNNNFIGSSFVIYNVQGKKLSSGKLTTEITKINIKNYKKGIYFLKVHQNKKELKVFKIIKN